LVAGGKIFVDVLYLYILNDIQRDVMRICTHAENMRNRGNRKMDKTSRYKGVYKPKGYKKWVAYICCDRKIYRIGAFEREEDAAEAYNKKALELHGEFAFLNKIF
jgi:hypothetical protein